MIRKVVPYPIKLLTGVSKLSIPVDSVVMSVASLTNTNEIVHLLIGEPVLPEGEVAEREDLTVLAVNKQAAFSEPDDPDKILSYVGSAVWDNGYRITHVFTVDTIQEQEFINPEDYLMGEDLEEAKEKESEE